MQTGQQVQVLTAHPFFAALAGMAGQGKLRLGQPAAQRFGINAQATASVGHRDRGHRSTPSVRHGRQEPEPAGHLLEQLRVDRLVEVLGHAGPLNYRYAIGQRGRERAVRLLEISGYVGPAPVALESATRVLSASWGIGLRALAHAAGAPPGRDLVRQRHPDARAGLRVARPAEVLAQVPERDGVPEWIARRLLDHPSGVDRRAFDRIIAAGGYIGVPAGSAPDGNAILIPKETADRAMDAAACIGCGACVAACPNASAALFTGAKIAHLGLLPQGQPERHWRALTMVAQHNHEGFGSCTNIGECEAVCPKDIRLEFIARMNRDYIAAKFKSRKTAETSS